MANHRQSETWGITEAAFTSALAGQRVQVKTQSGTAYQGRLLGVAHYTLYLLQDNGLLLQLNKGALVYLHALEPNAALEALVRETHSQ